jgi:hypothetical protein
MFKSYGYLQILNGVRIIAPFDFVLYYQKLFTMATWNTVKSQIPKHKAHISIYLPDIHGKNIDISIIKHLSGKKIEFYYNPTDFVITKKNVWMKVNCQEAETIKQQLNIVDKNFLGFHMVVCNFKFDI